MSNASPNAAAPSERAAPLAFLVAVLPATLIAIKPGVIAVVVQLAALCGVLVIQRKRGMNRFSILPLLLAVTALCLAIFVGLAKL